MPADVLCTELCVYGVAPPTGLDGITRQWGKGDPIPNTRRATYPTSGWEVSSGFSETASFDDQASELLVRLEPSESYFLNLPADATRFYCWAQIYLGLVTPDSHSVVPMLSLRPATVERLARLRLGADVDLYIYRSEDLE